MVKLEIKISNSTQPNEIFLFTGGPGGSESEMAKEFFALNRTGALQELKYRFAAKKAKKTSNFKMFGVVEENQEY